jgi:hypothetical protein
MIKPGTSPLAVLPLVAVLFTACSDGPTEPQGSLTQAEAMAVFSEILSAVFQVDAGPAMSITAPGAGGPLASLGPAPAAALSADVSIEEAVPCESGGSIAVDGTIEIDLDDNETGSYVFSFIQTPSGCVVPTEAGPSYLVNGSPNLQMSGEYNLVEGELAGDFTMSFSGGLSWSAVNGGANGTCTVNLDYVLAWSTLTGSAEGHICGHDISQQF